MTASPPALINSDGTPMREATQQPTAYTAADRFVQEVAQWNPWLGSADADYLLDRDTIVARNRDIVRNNGYASGIVTAHLNQIIGGGLTLQARPDWRALGLDLDWARDFRQQAEPEWRLFAHDPGFYCDASRHTDIGGLFGQMCRQRLVDGESLALSLWLPDRGGRYATAIQVVDPDRLSNPNGTTDSDKMRAGVERDAFGHPIAYHIRKGHPYDVAGFAATSNAFTWERVPRETAWGRRMVLHDFDRERADQTRGIGLLTSVLPKFKMADRYEGVELQAAWVNAIFAAFIESSLDPEMVAGGFGASDVGTYQKARSKFHEERKITLDGVRVSTLFPGEKFNFSQAERPNAAFGAFMENVLRHLAAGTGASYEEVARDFSKTNYSSARAALLGTWRFLLAFRQRFIKGIANQVYALFLEEAIDSGRVELPSGAPDFWDMKAAYCRTQWIGPPRGWIDPVKEAQAAQMRMDSNISTLADEAAEQGRNWEDVLEQQAIEEQLRSELGLPGVTWSQITDTDPDNESSDTGRTTFRRERGAKPRVRRRAGSVRVAA